MMMPENRIPTYAINLQKRVDRRKHIITEFSGRYEYHLKIIPAVEHAIGAIGLWESIIGIVQCAVRKKFRYVLIVEDDHVFTRRYQSAAWLHTINWVENHGADVLLGGVSWFDTAVQINSDLFWLDRFNGTQFMVVFQSLYDQILNVTFGKYDSADVIISDLSDKIFVVFPFISLQKEFGYSDVTRKNGETGRLAEMFDKQTEKLSQLDTVGKYYGR